MSVLKSLSLNFTIGNERLDVSYKVNFEMKHKYIFFAFYFTTRTTEKKKKSK